MSCCSYVINQDVCVRFVFKQLCGWGEVTPVRFWIWSYYTVLLFASFLHTGSAPLSSAYPFFFTFVPTTLLSWVASPCWASETSRALSVVLSFPGCWQWEACSAPFWVSLCIQRAQWKVRVLFVTWHQALESVWKYQVEPDAASELYFIFASCVWRTNVVSLYTRCSRGRKMWGMQINRWILSLTKVYGSLQSPSALAVSWKKREPISRTVIVEMAGEHTLVCSVWSANSHSYMLLRVVPVLLVGWLVPSLQTQWMWCEHV